MEKALLLLVFSYGTSGFLAASTVCCAFASVAGGAGGTAAVAAAFLVFALVVVVVVILGSGVGSAGGKGGGGLEADSLGEDDGGYGCGVGAWGGEVVGVTVVVEDFQRHL